MSTSVLERPDVDETNATDAPQLFHYVKKTSILSSVVDGGMVQALCGEVFPVRKSPPPGAAVCEPCREVFDQMKRD